jgi:protoheme IX farnesyltransferase
MLPTGKKDTSTAVQIILYTVWTILVSLVPAFGVTGSLFLSPIAAIIVGALGLFMLYWAIKLYQLRDAKTAKRLMLSSVTYITLLQIVFVVDKFLR